MTSFLIAYLLTLVALAAAVAAGRARRRTLHFALVGATLALLALAVRFAEALGATLRFDGAARAVHGVHFVAVVSVLVLLAGMIATGIGLALTPPGAPGPRRSAHRRLARVFLLAVVATSGLGFAMVWLAEPR